MGVVMECEGPGAFSSMTGHQVPNLYDLYTRPRRSRGLSAIIALVAMLIAGGAQAAGPTDPLNLAAYKGKVVYLDFWASWCGPCKLSFPYMETLTEIYRPKGLVVLAVNVDHSPELAKQFLSQYGNHPNVVYDSNGIISKSMKIQEMPTSILIGKDGRIRYTNKGFFLEKTRIYESEILELLNEH
jgi:cytochrome c biogenesis protein CcmG/thiol:disulfide interchange protein DsbE